MPLLSGSLLCHTASFTTPAQLGNLCPLPHPDIPGNGCFLLRTSVTTKIWKAAIISLHAPPALCQNVTLAVRWVPCLLNHLKSLAIHVPIYKRSKIFFLILNSLAYPGPLFFSVFSQGKLHGSSHWSINCFYGEKKKHQLLKTKPTGFGFSLICENIYLAMRYWISCFILVQFCIPSSCIPSRSRCAWWWQ